VSNLFSPRDAGDLEGGSMTRGDISLQVKRGPVNGAPGHQWRGIHTWLNLRCGYEAVAIDLWRGAGILHSTINTRKTHRRYRKLGISINTCIYMKDMITNAVSSRR
jgi:hypothetical protein